jgi:hypothetical protein
MSNQIEKKKPAPVQPETFGQSFMGTLKHLLQDASELEVVTYVTYGDQAGEITLDVRGANYQAVLQAYTKISLDADTVVLLPARQEDQEIVVHQELYDIHKQHVEMAQRTRQEMITAMLNAVSSVMNVFGG